MSDVIVLNFRECKSSDGARDHSDGSSGNRNDGSNRCACRCTCRRTCRTGHNTFRHTSYNLVERARLEPMLINLPVTRHDDEDDRVGAMVFKSVDAEVKHALVAKRVEVSRSLNIFRNIHQIFVIRLAIGERNHRGRTPIRRTLHCISRSSGCVVSTQRQYWLDMR